MAQPRRTVHPDTRTGTDRTGSTVAADEPLGTHGVLLAAGTVLQHGAHAFLVLGEAQQAHAEPDPVGRRLAGPPQQDRLQRVLGTDHARRRRAHVAVRRIVGNAAAYEVRVDQIPAPVEENLGGRQAGGADLVFESAASEDLHRAGGDPAGLGMTGGVRTGFGQQVVHAVPGQQVRQGQTHRSATHDEYGSSRRRMHVLSMGAGGSRLIRVDVGAACHEVDRERPDRQSPTVTFISSF